MKDKVPAVEEFRLQDFLTLIRGTTSVGKSAFMEELKRIALSRGIDVRLNPNPDMFYDTEGTDHKATLEALRAIGIKTRETTTVTLAIDSRGELPEELIAKTLKNREPNKNMRIYVDSLAYMGKHDKDNGDASGKEAR